MAARITLVGAILTMQEKGQTPPSGRGRQEGTHGKRHDLDMDPSLGRGSEVDSVRERGFGSLLVREPEGFARRQGGRGGR